MTADKNILLSEFLNFIQKNKLVKAGEKILLTVSGGMDSTTMAHLISQTDFDFGIAHCNFSLRGKESSEDAEFVSSLAKNFHAPFHLKKFETTGFAVENKYSIQEAARILRYKWFEELAFEFNYDKIATAHHLDDSIETFFINLLRGTGTAGLKGISIKKGKIIRPLLFATRKEIEKYSAENKIDFREDSSNEKDDYLRNRIRHNILPAVKENAENFEENMSELMEDISFMHKIFTERLDSWKIEFANADPEGNVLLPLREILSDENPVSFLSALLYSYGIKRAECEKIIRVENPGKIFHAGDYTILRDREFLIISKTQEKSNQIYSISSIPAEISTGNIKISIIVQEKFKNEHVPSENKFQIDGEKLKLPLTLRTWQPGDYFFPLGMKGKKKISDFYTDEKINRFEKDKTYLLLSGTDIVCILGHRIDERYKITSSTTNILTIEITPA